MVYRLGIVAEPNRVMMLVVENIWELVHKGAQTPASLMARKRHLQQSQGVDIGFCLNKTSPN